MNIFKKSKKEVNDDEITHHIAFEVEEYELEFHFLQNEKRYTHTETFKDKLEWSWLPLGISGEFRHKDNAFQKICAEELIRKYIRNYQEKYFSITHTKSLNGCSETIISTMLLPHNLVDVKWQKINSEEVKIGFTVEEYETIRNRLGELGAKFDENEYQK